MPCPDGVNPEDIEWLLSGDADPLAHRRPPDLPEMDEVGLYRPPFEYPRSENHFPPGEVRDRLEEILRRAGRLPESDDA